MIKWHRLDNDKAANVIKRIKSSGIPALFSSATSEAKCSKLPFYNDFMLYRLTNYSSLPSFSLDYLGDGKRFYYMDGSAKAIVAANIAGSLSLGIDNVLDYTEFFFNHIAGADGTIKLLIDPAEYRPLAALPANKLAEITKQHKEPELSFDDKAREYNITATLDNAGTLVCAHINVTENGHVSITDQHMLLTRNAGNNHAIAGSTQ